MVWLALLFTSFVIPGIFLLILDGLPMFTARLHVDAATESACLAAAWFGGNRPSFREGGITEGEWTAQIEQEAVGTFERILVEQNHPRYDAALTGVYYDEPSRSYYCTGAIVVYSAVPSWAGFSQYTLTSEARGYIRFVNQ